MEFLDLKGKLKDRGPFGENENKAIIFSIGNSNEAHGYAMPRDIDNKQAQWVALNAANKAGARYIAHIPYSTDRVGDIAKLWSPNYLPFDEFLEKVINFIKVHVKFLEEYDLFFERIILVNFHGGNEFPRKAIRKMGEEIKAYKIKIFGPADFEFAEKEKMEYWLKKVAPSHADTTEHSIAANLGLVDLKKLEIMNELISKDMNAALKRWPEIGGLGGYLEFGDERFDPLRVPKIGLVAGYEKFKKDKKIFIHQELGKLILDSFINGVASICK